MSTQPPPTMMRIPSHLDGKTGAEKRAWFRSQGMRAGAVSCECGYSEIATLAPGHPDKNLLCGACRKETATFTDMP